MNKLYHLSLSSTDEVLFRSHEDYRRAFNCYTLALLKSHSLSYADAFMSNHVHFCVTSSDLKELCYTFKIGYGMYFNNKYKRKGPLFDSNIFTLEIEGIYHNIAAVSYVLRNPLHHGIALTPFDYPYCSANSIFRKELGKSSNIDILPKKRMWRFLPKNTKIDIPFRMDINGMFLREDVTEVKLVEILYGTARNYLYHMNRISDSKWEDEQKQDKTGTNPITISLIEHNQFDLSKMLRNEYSRKNYQVITDLELCEYIDNHILKEYSVDSIYSLSQKQKNEIGNTLYSTFKTKGISTNQISRCLAMKYY